MFKKGGSNGSKKEIIPVKPAVLDVYYPDDVDIAYVNHAMIAISNNDFNMDFGIRQPPLGGRKSQQVKINSRVVMSPQHAKMFILKLLELLQTYEKTFGEIQTEPLKK